MLTNENLLAAGYKRFNSSREGIKGGDYGYQKRIYDEQGIRYHITIYVYDWRPYKDNGALTDCSDFGFQPEVQYQHSTVYPTVTMTYFDDDSTTVETMEQFFYAAWVFMERPYYEEYDDNS